MSSTVAVGGFDISSNNESAQDMVKVLTPAKEGDKEPRIKEDQGKPVEPEQAKASEAARELGRRGGEAAAKAREERAKEEAKEEAKAAAEGEEGDEKPEAVEAKSRARARVEQATRQLAEERRRNQELQERLARLEEAVKPKEPAPREHAAADTTWDGNSEPEEDQFATYRDYVKAAARWEARQERAEAEAKAAAQAKEREAVDTFSKRAGTFYERIEQQAAGAREAVEEVLPLLEALRTRDMLRPGEWERLSAQQQAAVDLADEIVDCERPLEVLRYLHTNPDALNSIVSSKDAYSLRRAFGRMEAMLERQQTASEEPRTRTPSSAPPPLRPVAPSVQPGEPDFSKEMAFDEYVKKRQGSRR